MAPAWQDFRIARCCFSPRLSCSPLQLVLREILITSNVESMTTAVSSSDTFQVAQTIKYATIVVATAPMLLIYPFLQRYFVKGALIGAIKE